MDDRDILANIDDLVREEHGLRERAPDGGLSADEQSRLRQVEEQLDQCWDLLRQRRAREEIGENSDQARSRPVSEVEGYLQ